MKSHKLSTLAAVAALAMLGACSHTPVAERISTAPVTTESAMVSQYGRVTDIQTASRPSGAGTVLGAVLGAAVGSQVGSGTGRAAATGLGAVGGAVAGHQIEKRNADDVYRVTVRFDDGSTRNFDFQQVGDLRTGDRVKWENGQLYRM